MAALWTACPPREDLAVLANIRSGYTHTSTHTHIRAFFVVECLRSGCSFQNEVQTDQLLPSLFAPRFSNSL